MTKIKLIIMINEPFDSEEVVEVVVGAVVIEVFESWVTSLVFESGESSMGLDLAFLSQSHF